MLFLVFRLGSDRYAIDTTHVVEVLPLINWKRIPRAPVGVAGIIDYHGTPVPLIDLSELALGKPAQKWMSTRIVVVNYSQDSSGRTHVLGLIAEQATEMMRRTEDEFAYSGLTSNESPYLGPVVTGPGGIIQRIEIKHLLSENVRSQLLLDQSNSINGTNRF